MQVIGLCRFSWPGEGGFQVEHTSLDERIAYLYNDARMASRLAQFETITLPGLRAQTDPDFTFVVVIGETLPEKWADRLFALLETLPQAQVQIRPPGPHRKVMQTAINVAKHDPAAPCLQFRHDDDDAVAIDFVERLRQVAHENAPLLDQNRLVAIDFVNGFAAEPGKAGLHVMRQHLSLYPMALGMAAQGKVHQSIMNFGHKKMGQFMPVLTQTHPDMFIRGHSDNNDSRQKAGIKPLPLAPIDATTAQLFKKRFAIDVDHVRSAFSAL